jgi:zinc protease
MRRPRALVTLLLAAGAPLAAQQAPIRPLPVTRFVLPNGLTAILNEDHSAPLAAVDVYYRIGFRDDVPGRIGIAHFCEHLMGEGSPNISQPQSTFYRTVLGGTTTRAAITNEDVTHYFVTVPSNQLETVIWAEGDRLRHALSMADSQHVASVRGVVSQERLGFENLPLAVAPFRNVVGEYLYPTGHPYHNAVATPMPDMAKISPRDVREACGPYYVPNNAVIAVSGDFTAASAKAWITKYFGSIPRGATPTRAAVPKTALSADQRLVMEDPRTTTPRLRIVWPGAAYADPDRIPLLALATTLSLSRISSDGHLASIGVEPPSSLGRLSKLLIDERQLATSVNADNLDQEHAGVFEIAIDPRPNASLSTIETLVDSVITAMAKSPVTAEELARYNSYNAVHLATSLQRHFMRADTLAHDEVYAGDAQAYAKQANAARRLTAADVERVRKRFLAAPKIVVSVVPVGKTNLASKPDLPYVNATPAYVRGTK